MKIKYIQLFVISMVISVAAHCQHQLYFENFEGSTNTFTINDSVKAKKTFGNNKWIVNKIYTGGVGVPNTLNEDSTFGGTISYAPYGKYLHIFDSASTKVNDAYNPKDSSYAFAHMTTGVCTKSLTNIHLNFFYLCQGSPTAYGVLVYSINGGAWTPTGDTLRYRYKWQYATPAPSSAYDNVEDLRFGFLWKNNNGSGKDTSALGLDDISIYATYDSINHPIKCTFQTILDDSCLGGSEYVYFGATLSDSTCDAIWDVYMSNGNGQFPGLYAWYGYVGPSYYNDINNYWYLTYPNSFTTVGHCYKFKLVRTVYPYLSFTDSVCFPFDTCPGTITTLQPPATLDTNAVCAGSVIDVPFFSVGIYDIYNVYFCQLIDSIGNTATIDTIGHLVSNVAYPYPPGDIVSTIPYTVPAGCRYYVRVVCNTGNRPSTMWGPFCIQHCDIVTDSNTSQTLQACLESCRKEPKGWHDSIIYDIHKYDSIAKYAKGNKFEVQLIQFVNYPPSFGAINTGLLGAVYDTTSGKMYIHVPCPDTLFANGINPGVYYIRVIADSSSFSDSSLGTLVHLTIGEPADSMYLTVSSTGPYCTGSNINVNANPNDGNPPYNSTYSWWVTDKTHGRQPFNNWTYPYLSFYNSTGDTLIVTCQENNNGCLGNMATLSDTIIVIGEPNINKTGPTYLCLGDTGQYSIPFANNTNYIWSLPPKVHADTSNNVLKIRFDSVGVFTFTVLAINPCYSRNQTWTVHVIKPPVPVIVSSPSNTFCAGVVDTLKVSGGTSYKWSTGSNKTSITVAPVRDTAYWVKVSNQGCSLNDTVRLTVLASPKVLVKQDTTVCFGDTTTLKASGAHTYIWLPNTGLVNNTDSIVKAVVTANQTYTVTGTALDGCKDTNTVSVGVLNTTGSVSSATSIPEGASVTLLAGGGSSYVWAPSTGLACDTCPSINATPSVTTTYTVTIKDANGCYVSDTVTVDVIPNCGLFVPNAFSPGNPNKQNIVLYVRSECLTNNSFDFIVYDRWGNKVFESKDLKTGWDGTFNNAGQPMNPGTYVYYVTGITTGGKTLTKKGNVALIR